jgi:hypothetical protein
MLRQNSIQQEIGLAAANKRPCPIYLCLFISFLPAKRARQVS